MDVGRLDAMLSREERWDGVTRLPWEEPDFSERMLAEHLSQAHDGASRRMSLVERHVEWIDAVVLHGGPARVLDLGCGPGLYTQRLAERGHNCAGIDISPAAIAFARAQTADTVGAPRYLQADVLHARFGEGLDLVMMVHGELNVFGRDNAVALLRKVAGALSGDGRCLLEVHTVEGVRSLGMRPRAWSVVERDLFSGRPHLRLDESRWDAASIRATNLHWIVDPATGDVMRFGTLTQGYSDGDYSALFAEAGLAVDSTYPTLTGAGADASYTVFLARLPA